MHLYFWIEEIESDSFMIEEIYWFYIYFSENCGNLKTMVLFRTSIENNSGQLGIVVGWRTLKK